MLGFGATVTTAAFRRSPLRTAVTVTVVTAAPAVVVGLIAASMILMGMAGSGQGHHWSTADFPRWYWRRPGGVRGMNNREAVRVGGAILIASITAILAILGMWIAVARPMVRSVLKRHG